jgi:ApbE superfamily uncharacterized protein (UPF0280 family)
MTETAPATNDRSWSPPRSAWLGDGRLHLQDGPIDLIIRAWGSDAAVATAYRAATRRLDGLLVRLCCELPGLRRAADRAPSFENPIAQRMHEAVVAYADEMFITPMAAVAGAVAEAVLEAMTAAAPLDRAYVNNGGDIALHLTEGQTFAIGLVDRPDRPSLFANARIGGSDRIGGIATSGWRGRSFSLGIADAVTVLAQSAADADAAATVVANAVDLPDHPGIGRVPAADLLPDSDLGRRRVTRSVPPLNAAERIRALEAGAATAKRLIGGGLIRAAALHLQGQTLIVGNTATAKAELCHA